MSAEMNEEGRKAGMLDAEIKECPDRILEIYECCPQCGGKELEALTWKSIGLDDVTVGCWECDWWILPKGVEMSHPYLMEKKEGGE